MPIFKRNTSRQNSKNSSSENFDNRKRSRRSRSQTKALTLPTAEAMKQCFEAYLKVEVADGNAAADTVTTYTRRTARFLAWCSDRGLSPARIGKAEILLYRRYLIQERQLKSNTIALTLVVLRQFYHACQEAGLIKDNPAVAICPPRAKVDVVERITFLDLEQLRHLLSIMNTDGSLRSLRDRALISLMALEGLRTVELNRASVGNIRGKRGSQCSLVVEGKGKIRTVPLRGDLAELLWQYLEARSGSGELLRSQSSLFISLSNRFSGRRLSRRGIRYIVDRYLEEAGLKEIDADTSRSCHSLRHTAGTLGLAGGASLRQVQELLGHSDPKTTAIYAHVLERHENNPALGIDVEL